MTTTPVETNVSTKAEAASAPAIAPDGTAAAIRSPIFGQISWNSLLTTLPIYIGLILIWLYFDSQTAGKFIGARNLSEMAQEFSYESVLAIGIVFVLVLGEIDLSLGYLTLLSVALVGVFSQLNHWGAGETIIAAIVICTLCGLAQGFLIAWVRMPAFVVTLGGFLIFEGVAFHILGGSTINIFDPFITSLGNYFLNDTLSWIIVAVTVVVLLATTLNTRRARARANLPPASVLQDATKVIGIAAALVAIVATTNSYRGVPIALALLGAFTAIAAFLAKHSRFGRHIYAVGGNQEAARRAGINTTAVRWIAFGVAGTMAGITGVLLAGYSNAASTTVAGPDLLLDIISIAVIGGVSLTGGKGSVWGVLLGGLLIASVDSGLNLMSVDPDLEYVVKGAILLAAIFIDVVGKRRGQFALPPFLAVLRR